MAVGNIQAVVRLVRDDVLVEERAVFPDTGNVNVLLQRLGADAHRRFKPQMLMAKEREERELQEHMRQQQQEEQAAAAIDPRTPELAASEPPTIQAVHQLTEASQLFQQVNAQLDRLGFAMQQMNNRLYDIENREEDIRETMDTNTNHQIQLKFEEIHRSLLEEHLQMLERYKQSTATGSTDMHSIVVEGRNQRV